ncbi:MAG: hypothetical protein RLZZ44_1318 [Bacteroidota bacterium]
MRSRYSIFIGPGQQFLSAFFLGGGIISDSELSSDNEY